jgi:hypothetical protein
VKRTPQLADALDRLRPSRDFGVFLTALEDYLASLTERLISADDERLQVAQGMCRATKSIVDVIKEK